MRTVITKWGESFKTKYDSLKLNQKILISTIFGLSIFGVSLPNLYKVEWVGFGEEKIITIAEEEALNLNNGKIIKLKKETEQIKPGKSLWDWIGLLIGLTGSIGTISIPILAIHLTNKFQKNERQRAEQIAKEEAERAEKIAKNEAKRVKLIAEEEALQNYIDKMSDLLIDKNLDELTNGNTLSNIIQARTTSIIRRLDENLKLKRNIIVFLIDTEIIKKLKIDWSYADLSHINLSNVNLEDANLKIADLSGANFSGANLSGANLSGADLSGANLKDVNLSGANLKVANLRSAKLYGVNLKDANLEDAYLSNADFGGAKLYGADLILPVREDTKLCVADLSGANLRNANLRNAYLRNAKLYSANLNGTNLYDAHLLAADLTATDLTAAKLTNAKLFSANLNCANLTDTDLTDTNLTDADLTDANLTNANLTDANLSGAKFWDKKSDTGREARNITPYQIQKAKNWEKAIWRKYSEAVTRGKIG